MRQALSSLVPLGKHLPSTLLPGGVVYGYFAPFSPRIFIENCMEIESVAVADSFYPSNQPSLGFPGPLEAWPAADSVGRQLAANCYGLIMCTCVACLGMLAQRILRPVPPCCSNIMRIISEKSTHQKGCAHRHLNNSKADGALSFCAGAPTARCSLSRSACLPLPLPLAVSLPQLHFN